jgi:hypothetical protein
LPLSVFRSWDPEDQDAALAYEQYENELCPSCGTLDEEWRDPETKKPYKVPPYEVESHRCAGCQAMGKARTLIPKDDTDGVFLRMRRYDPIEHLRSRD